MDFKLVDGEWRDASDINDGDGSFERAESTFREWVKDESGARFPPESGRYHLYIAHACPWCHRVMLLRSLLGLEDAISVSIAKPLMLKNGWEFDTNNEVDGSTPDHVLGKNYVYQIYQQADDSVTARATVPILWDKKTGTIVNNESADLMKMFNGVFRKLATKELPDLYPSELAGPTAKWNKRIYDTVNNGVYKCGFATKQPAYEKAFAELFETLDAIEQELGDSGFLFGDQITAADWRLFVTLLRFDLVYFGHFKCNKKRIVDYPKLWRYTRELFAQPGVREATRLDHIQQHYYGSHKSINPTGIVPVGPEVDWSL